jgi:hypothetical protein
MFRTIFLVGITGLTAGCSLTPSVTKSRMTLAEANISDMECRRGATTGTSIPRTVCASEKSWNSYDKKRADDSEQFLNQVYDSQDNRVLYQR